MGLTNWIYMTFHVEKTLKAVPYQMCGNSFKEKKRITEHLQKKHKVFWCFILKISTFQMFDRKYKIETSNPFLQYSHYCLKSLGLSALWVFEFYHNLSFRFWSQSVFEFCLNLSFWVWSQFKFYSFVTI